MFNKRWRALAGSLAPSAAVLAVAVLGLALDTYWQYVLAISISAAATGGALAMLVSYARCITIATGAMLAIGAYGAAIPVVLAGVPFGAALVFATALRKGWTALARAPDAVAWTVAAGAWVGILAFLVGGLTQYTFGDNEVALTMWVALGVLMRAAYEAGER